MTIHVTSAIDITKVKTRWEEPYVSEAIDKMMSVLGKGVHHGFRMTSDGGQIVRLSHDTEYGDSLALILDENLGQAFEYREDTEATLDLTPVSAGTRAWVFLFVDYSVGVATTAEVRVADAAELANPWVNQALPLGTVRKPSAGAIGDGDIDHGSGEWLGLAGGDSSRWVSVHQNVYFEKGLAGFELGGAGVSSYPFAQADYVTMVGVGDSYKGDRAARLGDTSGAQPSPDTGELRIELPQLLENDIVFWRFRAKAASVTNGGILRVALGAYFDETILDADLGSYEQFGYAVEITSDADDQSLDIIADLTAGVTATGHFDIDEVEVYIFRPTGTVAAGNMDVAGRFLMADAGGFTARLGADFGSWNLSDANASFDITDAADGGRFADIPVGTTLSLVAGLNHALRGGGAAMDLMHPKAVFEGGEVTDGTSGGANVDVSALKVRTAALSPTVAGAVDRYYEQDAVVDLALPVTSGVEEFFVTWDPNAEDFVAYLTSDVTFSSNEDVVILAYVEHDGGTGLNTRIIEMQDFITDLERKTPITVGASANARFSSLEGALRMADQSGFTGTKEIVVTGTTTLGTSSGIENAQATIPVPDGIVVRGAGDARVSVSRTWYDPTVSPKVIFDLPDGGDVVFRDLLFTVGNGTEGDIVLFSSAGNPRKVTIANVEVEMTGSQALWRVIDCVPTRALTVRDCYFQCRSSTVGTQASDADAACIWIENTAPNAELAILIDGCSFGGDDLGDGFTSSAQALHIVSDTLGADNVTTIHITNTRFLEADLPVDLDGRVIMDNVFSLVPIHIDADSQDISVGNVVMDLSEYEGRAAAPSSEAFKISFANRGTVANVSINAPNSPVSWQGLDLPSSSGLTISNISIKHADGDAVEVFGSENVVRGLNCESTGADAGRSGLSGTASRLVAVGGYFDGYAADAAIDASNFTDSVISEMVFQQGGGTPPYISSIGANQTGNTYEVA